MNIPSRLRDDEINFVLIPAKSKRPFEVGWQKKQIKWNDEKLISHLNSGGNYGVMGGGNKNLIIVDFDNEKVQQELCKQLPDTFTVKTGSGLLHKYFFSNDSASYKIFNKEMDTLADVQGEGKQVVGPGSIHPSGARYEIVNNKEIASIDYNDLKNLIMPYNEKPARKIRQKDNIKKTYTHSDDFQEDLFNSVSLESLLSEFGVDTSQNPSNCPFHSSKGRKCLGWDEDTVHCFHCDGSWNKMSWLKENLNTDAKGAIEWLADKEGRTAELEKSRERWAYDKMQEEFKQAEKNIADNIPDEARIKIMSHGDLRNYEAPEYEWRIEKILQDKKIMIIAGSSATYKSWFCLNLGICVSLGLDFLDNFHTEKGGVLYIDRENSIPELKSRLDMLMKGMNIPEDKTLPIYFISEQSIKLDNFEDREQLREIIKKNNIKLVIGDVYRRLISYEENDAGAVSKFFTDGLKPICEETGASFIFIHHHKKGRAEGDAKELLRGSSDLVNFVDGILQVSRVGIDLTIAQTKSRSGKELEPFSVVIDTDEETYFKFIYRGEKIQREFSEKCAEMMIDWIKRNNLKEITSDDFKRWEEEVGIKRSMRFQARKDLVKLGILYGERGENKVDMDVLLKHINSK